MGSTPETLPSDLTINDNSEICSCSQCNKDSKVKEHKRKSRRNGHIRRRPKFNFKKQMNLEGTKYDVITSVGYLSEKYGLRKSRYIERFIKCIHRKINYDVSAISDEYVENLGPWIKSKLFLLLVTLSERGGPEYWLDKNDPEIEDIDGSEEIESPVATKHDQTHTLEKEVITKGSNTHDQQNEPSNDTEESHSSMQNIINENPEDNADSTNTLIELIIRQNINQDFRESTYDEDYVFSSIWANFMEGLINHYLEKVIVPHSEMKVCQQLYKPMMKIISLYNEYNELMEKSERNGFLPSPTESNDEDNEKQGTIIQNEKDDIVTKERLHRAQKLLWQAREDIPKTISKELTLLSEMYSTLLADEQDYELDEFVCCAEEYIELEFLPGLVDVLFNNSGTPAFWKVLLVLEPFFYYIEDVGDIDDDNQEPNDYLTEKDISPEISRPSFKPDPRVITLEKICEVAARQKWI